MNETELARAMDDLFNGGAAATAGGEGFRPAPGLGVRQAIRDHLAGKAIHGIYPFRGAEPGCGCKRRRHVCDGLGTRYLVFDVDDHHGHGDAWELLDRLLAILNSLDLRPGLVVTSKSERGFHVYLFLDRALPTRITFAAQKAIRQRARIETRRCDLIPGANHFTGIGSLHALPFSPLTPGGDLVGEEDLELVLRRAHRERVCAESLASLVPEPQVLPQHLFLAGSGLGVKDRILWDQLLAGPHPEFNKLHRVTTVEVEGGRSNRDAHLAALLLRAGLSPRGVVHALVYLVPGSKAAQRGEEYASQHLVQPLLRLSKESRERRDRLVPLLAGTQVLEPHHWLSLPLPEPESDSFSVFPRRGKSSLSPRRGKSSFLSLNQKRNLQERFDQARGWRCEYLHLLKNTTRFLREHRRLPGTTYRIGGKECPNPYWTPEVQEFLAKHRSKQLPALFAFLVDYWVHVGQRRHCYLSEPMIKDFLGMQNGARLLRYLREAPRGILHLTPGVRHPTLRIASSIEVPALPSADALDWTPSEAAEITRVNVPVKPRAKRRRRVL